MTPGASLRILGVGLLVPIVGMAMGMKCYLQGIGTLPPLFGVLMNALWLASLGILFLLYRMTRFC